MNYFVDKKCQLCPQRRNKFMRISMHSLTSKYFVNFFFYFAKPINEIILRVPHIESVIDYYENLHWDDHQELMTRFYPGGSSKDIMRQLVGKNRNDAKNSENKVLNRVQQVLERHMILSNRSKSPPVHTIKIKEEFRPAFVLQETAHIMQKREKKLRNVGRQKQSTEKKDGKVYDTLLKGLESLLQEKREVNEFQISQKFDKRKVLPEEEDSLKLEFESFLKQNEKMIPTKEKRITKKQVKSLNRNQLIMDLVKEFEEKTNQKSKKKRPKSNEKKPTVTVKSGAMTERSHKPKKGSVEKSVIQAVRNLSKLSEFKKMPAREMRTSANVISPLPGKPKKSGAKTTREIARRPTKERVPSGGSKVMKSSGRSGGIACRINLSKVHNLRNDCNNSKSGDHSKSSNRPITERNLTCNRNIDDIYGFLTTRKKKEKSSLKAPKANILKAKAKELVLSSRAGKKESRPSQENGRASVEGKSEGPSINCKFNFKLDLRGIKREFN